MTPEKKPARKKRLIKYDFDIEQTLLKNRQLMLFGSIDEENSEDIIEKLFALDTLNKNPITIYINSPGGECDSGISIINTIKTINSPVNTVILGEACSMASSISIQGDKRFCYENSVFMVHDMSVDLSDYSLKAKDRAKFNEKYYNLLEKQLKENTSLSDEDLELARSGELWLFSDEMLEKGVVDEVICFE